MLKAGQKVRCNYSNGYLSAGVVYTIDSVYEKDAGTSVTVKECLTIQGLDGYPSNYFDEVKYNVELSEHEIKRLNDIHLVVTGGRGFGKTVLNKLMQRINETKEKVDNNLI